MSDKYPITLDVFSDVVCPWCFVGKRRIERAATLLGEEIHVRWHPFELNPQMPPEGMSRTEYRNRKFGPERARALEEQLITVGRHVGIEFRFDLMERTPNTRAAHVVLRLASEQGLETQERTAERLFTGYFERGENVGNPDFLLGIAREMNIDAASATLHDPELRRVVQAEEQEAMAMGVQGVPCIFRNGRLIATGAQPEQILANALRD